MKRWEEWLQEQAEKAARRWHNLTTYNPYGRYYLWFLPGVIGGGLAVGADKPGEKWELGWPDRISPAWTEEYVRRWIYEKARKLPCLPLDL